MRSPCCLSCLERKIYSARKQMRILALPRRKLALPSRIRSSRCQPRLQKFSPPRVAVIRCVVKVDRLPSAIKLDILRFEPVVALIRYRRHLLRGVVKPLLFAFLPASRFRIQIFRMPSHRDRALPHGKMFLAKPLPRRMGLAAEAAQPVLKLVPGLPAEVLAAASAAQPRLPRPDQVPLFLSCPG